MENAASGYCAQVNQYLRCPGSMKRTFLRQLRSEIGFYLDEHGKQDLQSLYAAFGTPEEVAEEFLAELSPIAVAKCTRKQKKILAATVIVVVLAVMAAGILGLQSRAMRQKLDGDGFVASVTYKEDIEKKPLWALWQETVFGHTDIVE